VNRKNVATVTLNPAIDHTIFVSTFTPNGLNRAEAVGVPHWRQGHKRIQSAFQIGLFQCGFGLFR